MGQAPTYTAHNVGFRCAASSIHADARRRENMRIQKEMPKRMPRHHAQRLRDEL